MEIRKLYIAITFMHFLVIESVFFSLSLYIYGQSSAIVVYLTIIFILEKKVHKEGEKS